MSVIATSGGHCQRDGRGGPTRCDGAAVGEQFTAVVKHDDAVAQPAPALLGVTGDNPGRQVIGRRPSRASRLMLTHFASSVAKWFVGYFRLFVSLSPG
jgi:hypothetical protein